MDISVQLSRMTRPSMLVRAARLGANAKKRRPAKGAQGEPPYFKLIDEEARLNDARRNGDAGYSPTRHVEVLSALLSAAGYGSLPGA